jgi:hypothetical protein
MGKRGPKPGWKNPLPTEEVIPESKPEAPQSWRKGQLLNVRNAGACYNVTLIGEEYDPRHPERALQFTNVGELQQFVSAWYQPESPNPLAR